MKTLKKSLLACVTACIAFTCIATPETSAKTNYEITTSAELENILTKEYSKLSPSFTVTYIGDTKKFLPTLLPTTQNIIAANDKLLATVHRYSYKSSSTPTTATIQFNSSYFTTSSKQIKADKKIKSVVNTIKKKHKSKESRIKAVNDYIVKNTRYSNNKDTLYSAYGVLYDKQAVCQGYAYTTYLMLKELGYSAKYVTGTGNGAAHAWVMVKIGKNWYHLDTTFNDPLPDRKNKSSYTYYLVSDKTLAKTHEWNTKKYPKALKNYKR